MENSKLSRLTLFAEQTWSNLSPNEREAYYYDTGVIGFVEDCMKILRIEDSEITVEQMDFVCDRILDDHLVGKIYGSYVPTDDITVIFEEWFDDDGNVERLLIRGFYYGEPTVQAIEDFYRDYEANFD